MKYKFTRIIAAILPENLASQKVVMKADMKYTCDLTIKNVVSQIYEISRDEYLRKFR